MSYTDFPSRSSRRRSEGSPVDPFGDTTLDPRVRYQRNAPNSPAGSENGLPSAHLPEETPRRRHTLAPDLPIPPSHINIPAGTPHDVRRGSDGSEVTLTQEDPVSNINFSSYQHTYDIPPPRQAAGGHIVSHPRPDYIPPPIPDPEELRREYDEDEAEAEAAGLYSVPADERRRGTFSNILRFHQMDLFDDDDDDGKEVIQTIGGDSTQSKRPWGFKRMGSAVSNADMVLDPDNPTVTGMRKASHMDPEDTEKNVLRDMNYYDRRKQKRRMRIEFNITSVYNRQMFLMKLAKALMVFGAPSHRIESQLLSAARLLEVDAEYVNLPGIIICSFGDQESKTSDTHFMKTGGRLSLGSLHEVHQIYREVMHDEISAKQGTEKLEDLLNAPPIYNVWIRCSLAFTLAALICPFAFGGSFLDMWFAGLGGIALCIMHSWSSSKSQIYATVFEISVTVAISIMARGLSSIRSRVFCYTAISSAGIVSILPGYLILTSSLELASKNLVCGSIKMIYALIYTLFIGFGLNLGSDIFLLFDEPERQELKAITDGKVAAVSLSGYFIADNTSLIINDYGAHMFSGKFTFSNVIPVQQDNIIVGCYRPPSFPWYLQSWPWWTQFFIVPLFATVSSLSNLQPLKSLELIVMVAIASIAYVANKVADHFIFQRSDVVSAIGAFVIGILGNVYSRRMGGTAFTSMVTGVLFLVPSGLSESGGITAQGNGIAIGYAMISVTVGITVGLFMSQTIVYMFGHKKNAGHFSF